MDMFFSCDSVSGTSEVSDMSFDAIWHTMKGDLESMMTSRHLFRYTSQEARLRPAERVRLLIHICAL